MSHAYWHGGEWEQVHWESYHSAFVAGVDIADWRRMLVLEERG